jgi:hypothetical protein
MLQDSTPLLPLTVEGWLNIIARLIATAVVVWGALVAFLKGRFQREEKKWMEAVKKECEERKTADRHIENRLANVATDTHTHMGKFELLKEQLHENEKQRIRELEKMRQEMVAGFARIQGMLRTRGFHNQREEDL